MPLTCSGSFVKPGVHYVALASNVSQNLTSTSGNLCIIYRAEETMTGTETQRDACERDDEQKCLPASLQRRTDRPPGLPPDGVSDRRWPGIRCQKLESLWKHCQSLSRCAVANGNGQGPQLKAGFASTASLCPRRDRLFQCHGGQ